jgi:hypothetical protein
MSQEQLNGFAQIATEKETACFLDIEALVTIFAAQEVTKIKV